VTSGRCRLAMVRLLGFKSEQPESAAQLHFHGGGIGGRASNKTLIRAKQEGENRDANGGAHAKSKEVCQ